MIGDRNKPNRYTPKNSGIVTAVLWSGKASCLIGMPKFDEVVCAINNIDKTGLLLIYTDRDVEEGIDSPTRARPNLDYIVIDSFGKIDVWSHEFLSEHYDSVPAEAITRETHPLPTPIVS